MVFIISVLSMVVLVNYQESRKQVRDELRIAQIEQLSVAMRLYAEKYGGWPDCDAGIILEGSGTILHNGSVGLPECSDKDKIIDFLNDTMEDIPVDPLGPGNSDYYYYYDDRACPDGSGGSVGGGGGKTAVIYAVNLEVFESNAVSVCDPSVGFNDGGYQDTVFFGGSIDPSKPYAVRVDRYK